MYTYIYLYIHPYIYIYIYISIHTYISYTHTYAHAHTSVSFTRTGKTPVCGGGTPSGYIVAKGSEGGGDADSEAEGDDAGQSGAEGRVVLFR